MKNIILNTISNFKILSIFPELYNYSAVAPFILRVALGIMLIKNGGGKEKTFGSVGNLISAVTGVFLIIGFYTQLAAIVASVLSLIKIFSTFGNNDKPNHIFGYYFLSLVIAMSLTLIGPGIFSIDLPL